MDRIKLEHIRGKTKIPIMLLALIIRGRKLLYFSENAPFALIRGRTKLEK